MNSLQQQVRRALHGRHKIRKGKSTHIILRMILKRGACYAQQMVRLDPRLESVSIRQAMQHIEDRGLVQSFTFAPATGGTIRMYTLTELGFHVVRRLP